ncbi:CLUMA_CG018403, isoform A [Clunio marinus]|uniref:CLUMA_CG018403, isoform A n=1 Tax=Clunio marinus TaxID=568069 RepID=A0A1J1J115_9DIPT|nr:CLUMA_CG018403, isoform A [Clunio marinus]
MYRLRPKPLKVMKFPSITSICLHIHNVDVITKLDSLFFYFMLGNEKKQKLYSQKSYKIVKSWEALRRRVIKAPQGE